MDTATCFAVCEYALCRGVARVFENVRTGRKVRASKALQTKRGPGVNTLLFNCTVWEMPFPALIAEHFREMNTKENVVTGQGILFSFFTLL